MDLFSASIENYSKIQRLDRKIIINKVRCIVPKKVIDFRKIRKFVAKFQSI